MPRLFIIVSLILILVACTDNPASEIAYENLPATGDRENGEMLFVSQVCNGCHIEGATGAPNLAGLSERAGTTVEGQSAREYVFYSIVEPARHIVDGFGNAMPNDYDNKMTAQEMADLIAYLLDI